MTDIEQGGDVSEAGNEGGLNSIAIQGDGAQSTMR